MIIIILLLISCLCSLNVGQMLKRELQVSPSSVTLENPVGDKRPQQSHPAEDGGGCAGSADAAHDPWSRSAAYGEVLSATLDQTERDTTIMCVFFPLGNISCNAGTRHEHQSWLWVLHHTTEPWREPHSPRHPLQHPGSGLR